MNKLKLLIAPLLVLPFAIGCNTANPINFFLSNELQTVVEGKTATIYLDWQPSDHSIKFDAFSFASQPAKDNTISFDKESGARPMPVNITFTEGITEDVSGSLSFTYEDLTAKAKGNSSINIVIHNPHYVSQNEYEHAISLEDVVFLQVEQVDKQAKKTINEFSPTVYHMNSDDTGVNKYIVKEGNAYNKYYRMGSGEWEYIPNVDASEFLTPQTHDEIQPKRYLDALQVVYGQNLYYDIDKGVYKARTLADIELEFYDKKITVMEYSFSETDGERYAYTYEEKTPELPIIK